MLGEIRITSWLTRDSENYLSLAERGIQEGKKLLRKERGKGGEGEAVGILNMNMIL